MYIETKLSPTHIELIKIFLQANQLTHTDVMCVKRSIDNIEYEFLDIVTLDEDDNEKLTYMGLIHSGILNMFDDYLIKCGIPWDFLPPRDYRDHEANRDAVKRAVKEVARILNKDIAK